MQVRTIWRLYPLLFAVIPVFHTVASNPGQSRLSTLGAIVLALWCGFGLLYLLIHWVRRERFGAFVR